MWAACALVLVSVILAVGLLSPARAAWGVGSVYAGGFPGSASRKVSMCDTPTVICEKGGAAMSVLSSSSWATVRSAITACWSRYSVYWRPASHPRSVRERLMRDTVNAPASPHQPIRIEIQSLSMVLTVNKQ